MIKFWIVCVLACLLAGCANTVNGNKVLGPNELNTKNEVDVINAVVTNPYPECNAKGKETKRLADLEATRGERVYLQDGKICKISNY